MEVLNGKQKKQYIRLPAELHRGHSNWVPPIWLDEKTYYNPSKNKSFHKCDTILMLALKEGVPAGRIMGIINRPYNEVHNERHARFAWLDYLRKQCRIEKIQRLTMKEFNDRYIKHKNPQRQLALELMIAESLGKMPMHLRELFFLWKVQDLTTLQIAELYGISDYFVRKWKVELKERLYRDIFRDFSD